MANTGGNLKSTSIKGATPDGEFLIASGIYPPHMKVYELKELALKFKRHLISEINRPLSTQSPALNVISRSKVHGLFACGGEDGVVKCFDMRTRQYISRLHALASSGDFDQEVTTLGFKGDYYMAFGSSGGKLLDLRCSYFKNLTEEMDGGSQPTIYDDFKFLTIEEASYFLRA
uniref:Uncharacterized protein n=1 Tax=Kalanchoe fedtschenkoi TaxID=63787 RepID=A0A7N0TP68_KALFE